MGRGPGNPFAQGHPVNKNIRERSENQAEGRCEDNFQDYHLANFPLNLKGVVHETRPFLAL